MLSRVLAYLRITFASETKQMSKHYGNKQHF